MQSHELKQVIESAGDAIKREPATVLYLVCGKIGVGKEYL